MEQIKKKIQETLFKNLDIKNPISNRFKFKWISKHHSDLLFQIQEKTSFLDEKSGIPERIYCILNGRNTRKRCPECNYNKIKFLTYKLGYQTYCSRSCAINSNETKNKLRIKQEKIWKNKSQKEIQKSIEKRKNTCLDKYSVENPTRLSKIKEKISKTLSKKYKNKEIISSFSNKEVQNKIKKINLKKYGYESNFASNIIKDKIKQANIKKYGYKNVFSSPEIKDKIKKTLIENYGVDNPSKSKEIIKKREKTCFDKYGKKSYMSTEYFKEKSIKTLKNKYGVSHPMQSEEIKKKIQDTCQNKYGVDYASQSHISVDIINKLNDTEWLKAQHHIMKKPTYLISQELGVSETLVNKRFHSFNIEVKRFTSSACEKEIVNFIKDCLHDE